MSIVYLIIAIFMLVAGIVISSLVLDRISDRFSFMPSTDSLIKLVIYFIVIVYMFPIAIMQSGIFGILTVVGFLAIYELFQYVGLLSVEEQVSNNRSIKKILELYENDYIFVYDIVDTLKLKDRNDYNTIIPKIIENLKMRNKIPQNFFIEEGRRSKT